MCRSPISIGLTAERRMGKIPIRKMYQSLLVSLLVFPGSGAPSAILEAGRSDSLLPAVSFRTGLNVEHSAWLGGWDTLWNALFQSHQRFPIDAAALGTLPIIGPDEEWLVTP